MNVSKIIQNLKSRLGGFGAGAAGAGVAVGGVGGAVYNTLSESIGDSDENVVSAVINEAGELVEGKKPSLADAILSAGSGIDIGAGELATYIEQLTQDVNSDLFALVAGGVPDNPRVADRVARILAKYAQAMMNAGVEDPQSRLDLANLVACIAMLDTYKGNIQSSSITVSDVSDMLIAAALADPYLKAADLQGKSDEDLKNMVANTKTALIKAFNDWIESNNITTVEWRAVEYGCFLYQNVVGIPSSDDDVEE